jgi:hypothetical protein
MTADSIDAATLARVHAGLDRLEIELPSWGFADTVTRHQPESSSLGRILSLHPCVSAAAARCRQVWHP